jgi:H/ACA ribonucleoprotein complex subunit 2
MGKDKAEKEKKREKKEKKRSETDGIHKHKKEKKKNSSNVSDTIEKELGTKVLDGLVKIETHEKVEALEKVVNGGVVKIEAQVESRPVGALVPFANPLAEDKVAKKVLKSVKKGKTSVLLTHSWITVAIPFQSLASFFFMNSFCNPPLTFTTVAAGNKSLKRGVKEVVKALRKSPVPLVNATISEPTGIVVLAADISPMDVISHIPVLCEDHGIPYVFVRSRAELGAAGATKRPTSVVMVVPKSSGKSKKKTGENAEGDAQEDFNKVYADLTKIVEKEANMIRV